LPAHRSVSPTRRRAAAQVEERAERVLEQVRVLAPEGTARGSAAERAVPGEPVPETDQAPEPVVALEPQEAPAAVQVAPRIFVLARARIPPVADSLAHHL